MSQFPTGQPAASESDRNAAIARLRSGYDAGRLTSDEFSSRTAAALGAQDRPALDQLVADLPATDGLPQGSAPAWGAPTQGGTSYETYPHQGIAVPSRTQDDLPPAYGSGSPYDASAPDDGPTRPRNAWAGLSPAARWGIIIAFVAFVVVPIFASMTNGHVNFGIWWIFLLPIFLGWRGNRNRNRRRDRWDRR